MRKYLLDSTPIAAYLSQKPWALRLIDAWLDQREAVTSILVYAEVMEYLRGRADFELRHEALAVLLANALPVAVTAPVAERYGILRRQLRPPHGPGLIGDIDTLIAATALEFDLTLVTTDGDFGRVLDLKLLLLPRDG